MAQNKGFIDKLMELPKGALIGISVVVVAVFGFLAVYYGFGYNKKPVEEERGPVVLDVPDATTKDYDKTRMESYRDAEMEENYGRSGADYWDSLGDDLVNAGSAARNVELDPNVYSPLEIYDIRNGKKTKEQVDAEHAAEAERQRKLAVLRGDPGASSAGPSPYPGYSSSGTQMTQEQKDSAYFARIEKAMDIATKQYARLTGTEEEDVPEPEQEEEERKIDLSGKVSSLPTDAMADDGIISSLVDDRSSGTVNYAGTVNSKPVKATFLKNETLSNGQRVIIRLMQDLTLSNGTVIPANTHITGTCNFSSRLKIDVKMLHYNGRMFPTDISIYDNDGTEGIYCPTVIDSEKKGKKAKKVAGDLVSAAGTVAGTVLTGNPFIGRAATAGLSAATSTINDDGSVSVRVIAGYEFYVFENKKDDKNNAYAKW